MSQQRAYALKDAYTENFAGASFAVGHDGSTFDVQAELEQGDGVIVTSDPLVVRSLDELEVLKRVAVPEGHEEATTTPDDDGAGEGDGEDAGPELVDSEKLTREALDDIAEHELSGYDPDDYDTKAAVADAINEARTSAGEGA